MPPQDRPTLALLLPVVRSNIRTPTMRPKRRPPTGRRGPCRGRGSPLRGEPASSLRFVLLPPQDRPTSALLLRVVHGTVCTPTMRLTCLSLDAEQPTCHHRQPG